MKGIILAGGTGSRLYPLTKGVSKHLLPVYDKPMIYYPLSVLMLAGITEILIITNPDDRSGFERLFGDGSSLGMHISYAVQPRPQGVVQAFLIAEPFIGSDSVTLILGDNIFWGKGFSPMLRKAVSQPKGATIFGVEVKDPRAFGVVEFDREQQVLSIEEKPAEPKSDFAITGLYVYDNQVVQLAKQVGFSDRGELEITALNQLYLDQGALSVELLGRGFAWLDTGTHQGLLEAASFVQTVEKTQGFKIACLEEIAWRQGWVSDKQLKNLASQYSPSGLGGYLRSLITKDT